METKILKSRYRDKSVDRSAHIEIQILEWRHEYSQRGSQIRVETGVLTLRYRDKSGDRSTHMEVQS